MSTTSTYNSLSRRFGFSSVQNTYGNTNYELNNHLGNVNAVITDRRFWNTTTLKYEADIEMKNDYYPFGMAMKGRQLTPDYRYGYNGMELDNEVSGNGNSYTTEFRQYDPRLGRWKSLDPLMGQFPWQSPYCAFDNNPVFYNDPLGLAAKEGDDKKNPNKTVSETNTGKGTEKSPSQIDEIPIVHKLTPEERKKIESKQNKSEHIKSTDNSIMSQFYRKPLNAIPTNRSGKYADGHGIFHTNKGDVNYDDRMKTSRKVDNLGKIAVGNLLIPVAIIGGAEAAPVISPYVIQGARVYHNTIGKNGGYVNLGLNWINQSYTTGNYYSLEGKSLTGLIMSASLTYNSTLYGQLFVGAVDPWLNITYKAENGLHSGGYLFNYSKNRPSLQKTSALSVIGLFGPLYQQSPFLKSHLGNYLIEQGLMAPAQKIINGKK